MGWRKNQRGKEQNLKQIKKRSCKCPEYIFSLISVTVDDDLILFLNEFLDLKSLSEQRNEILHFPNNANYF